MRFSTATLAALTLTLACWLSSATPSPAATTPIPDSICGITCDLTQKRLRGKLGTPTEAFVNSYNPGLFYDRWNSAGGKLIIVATWEPDGDDRFNELSVSIEGDYAPLKETLTAKGLDDPLLAMLGATPAEIKEAYGPPTEETTQWIRYALPGCPGYLAFMTYDQGPCMELRLMIDPGAASLPMPSGGGVQSGMDSTDQGAQSGINSAVPGGQIMLNSALNLFGAQPMMALATAEGLFTTKDPAATLTEGISEVHAYPWNAGEALRIVSAVQDSVAVVTVLELTFEGATPEQLPGLWERVAQEREIGSLVGLMGLDLAGVRARIPAVPRTVPASQVMQIPYPVTATLDGLILLIFERDANGAEVVQKVGLVAWG